MNATKQTAANNKLLETLKRRFNSKIYKRVSEVMNAEGREAALEFIGKFFRSDVRAEAIEELRAI